MVDPEAVRRRLREIDRRLGLLRDLREHGREDVVGDIAVQAQVERHLQLAIQSAIDVQLHILAEDTAETPEDYGSGFELLARQGVIDGELAGRLRSAAGLRNILVHGYLDVDPDLLWGHLERLGDLEAFADAAQRYLDSEDR